MISRKIPKIEELFDITGFKHKDMFKGLERPFDVLKKGIKKQYIKENIQKGPFEISTCTLTKETFAIVEGKKITKGLKFQRRSAAKEELTVEIDGKVFKEAVLIMAGSYIDGEDIEIGAGTIVEEGAYIKGPVIIGKYNEIRNGAYVRGEVITGNHCIIGHSSEVKSSVFLDGAKAPHFAYVGDSVLGANVNLGAGTKVSNLKITGDEIMIQTDEGNVATGLRKFGALIGDDVETGCNCVINPGTILGKKSMVYPCVAVRKDIYPQKSIIKAKGTSILI
jgi:NDP-sugar pyrophosphorylase family protein